MVDEEKKEEAKQESEEKVEDKGEDAGTAEDKEGKKKLSLIEEAKTAANELRKANEEKKDLLDREEKLMAEKALGGRSGLAIPEKPKEETDIEYSERVMRGEANPLKDDGFI